MQTLSVTEALKQGYTKYCFNSDGFQGLKDIDGEIDPSHFERDDIRIDNVLPFKDTKEEDDEKHVHPLQLDVIDRIVELYSNPGETILTPFGGVGSEVYSPVSMGRKAIGIELKDSYFKQGIENLKSAENRFHKVEQKQLF